MGANDQGADATAGRWITIPRTLCLVTHGDDVLLMKRGPDRRIFPNRYNGVGGHIESNEDPLTSAIREIQEETGLPVTYVRLRGIHNIHVGDQSGIMMFVFTAVATTKTLGSTGDDEGSLHWVPIDKAMSLDLVDDLPLILPRIFAMSDDEPPYFAHVSYDADDKIIISYATDDGTSG